MQEIAVRGRDDSNQHTYTYHHLDLICFDSNEKGDT